MRVAFTWPVSVKLWVFENVFRIATLVDGSWEENSKRFTESISTVKAKTSALVRRLPEADETRRALPVRVPVV